MTPIVCSLDILKVAPNARADELQRRRVCADIPLTVNCNLPLDRNSDQQISEDLRAARRFFRCVWTSKAAYLAQYTEIYNIGARFTVFEQGLTELQFLEPAFVPLNGVDSGFLLGLISNLRGAATLQKLNHSGEGSSRLFKTYVYDDVNEQVRIASMSEEGALSTMNSLMVELWDQIHRAMAMEEAMLRCMTRTLTPRITIAGETAIFNNPRFGRLFCIARCHAVVNHMRISIPMPSALPIDPNRIEMQPFWGTTAILRKLEGFRPRDGWAVLNEQSEYVTPSIRILSNNFVFGLWNVGHADNPAFIETVLCLKSVYKPRVMVLTETRVSETRGRQLIQAIGGFECVVKEPSEIHGGAILAWDRLVIRGTDVPEAGLMLNVVVEDLTPVFLRRSITGGCCVRPLGG